ncbi:MAG: autotransporter-associated beta strand repeat-containing protein [Thermoguttaceae bacterium]|nr:autotransporter-associated beta strand repeat-containing protein [Thermoguttaceae bacterium]MBQ2621725.1 autotransporter-associated beta strand repeat-containing protein [Thermoguttaceae bacterium]
MAILKSNTVYNKMIRISAIAVTIAAALMTSAKADVAFDGTTFSGSGIYSEAVNSTSALTATPSSGATITFTNNIVSTGNFTQTGENVVFGTGTSNSFNMLYVNNGSGNGAKMTLSGSMNLTELHVANTRTTNLDITEGATLNVSGVVYVNEAKNAQGNITQTGGNVSFTTSGSTSVRIGHWPNTGYPSRYNISGGTLSIPNTITYVAWDGYAEMNISGGTVTLKGLSLSNSANSRGTLTLTGGTLNMGDGGVSRNKRGASGSIEPIIQFGNGTLNATASHTWASNLNITLKDSATTTLNADSGKTITLASKLAGNGSIRKTGEGTLILSNANTYTGSTTVEGGTLKLTGNGVPGTGSSVTVNGTIEYAYSDDKTIGYALEGSGNLVKSGEYALTLPSASYYSGKTTVSEGTLILQDSSNFSSSEVEVKTGSYFKAGFNLDNTTINVNGGNFVLGTDNNTQVGVTVPDITVSNGGIVSFNMFDYSDTWYGYDYLEIKSSASMNSGYLNLVFNQDVNLWLDNFPEGGYELISFKGSSDDFTFTNMGVLVNGTSTSKWQLEKTDEGVFLMKSGDGPVPVTPYWNANSGDDLALSEWVIDHNPKLGVQFIEGTNEASEYTGTVVMSENASYEVGSEKILKMSGVISGSGAMEKIGAGTLYLSNANTYSGGTTISAGSVTISNPSALGTGSVTINGASLDATPAGNTQTFNNDVVVGENGATISVASGEYSFFKSISGSGDLTTNGYIHFNGTGGYNGHLTVASGFTRVNPGAVGVIDLTINEGGHFNIFESGTVQIGKLNSTADVEVFGSQDLAYTYEIGTGTTSSDTASFAGWIRGLPDKKNITIRKVGEGTQTFCRTGYGYAGTSNSIKEVIIDGGKMVINANHSVFGASSTTGFWGSAPITINEGGTLEYARSWNSSPNVQLTVNGGTLTLSAAQYLNKLTFNSATVNGGGELRAGYVGAPTWNVTGGTTTIDSRVVLVLKGDYKTLNVNVAQDATIDFKKSITGLDGYTGTNVVFNGTGNGPGIVKFNAPAGVLTGLGTFTFNNINAFVSNDAGWLANGFFNGSAVTLTNSTLTTNTSHTTNGTVFTLDNSSLIFDGEVNSYIHQITLKNGSSIAGTGEDSCFRTGHNWNSQFTTSADGTEEKPVTISANIAMYNTGKTATFNVADKAPLTISGSFIPAEEGHYNAIVKTGAGVLTLTGQNSHGATTVSEGTLVLAGNGTFGSGDVTNNAAIVFAHTSEQTLTNAISGTGTVAKTGSGKLTIASANTYSGNTTVSGGTLVLASSGSLATPNITVESGATFQTGTNLVSTNVALNGGSFVLGTSNSAAEITIADFALNGGTVNFDFYAATSGTNYDYLFTNAANLTSGAININFANNDELTWWNNTSGGYIIIDTLGISGSLDNIQLLVNSAQTSNWYLDTTGNYIVMKKQNDVPPVEDPYYLANTEEAQSADKWTIDGQDKKGVKFTEGDENAVTYGKEVEMEANGTVEVGEDRNLTLAGVVSGEGNVTKLGDGKLTLSGDNTYSGDTIVSDGTLTLTGDAVKANSSIEIADDATLEYNVAQGDSKQLTFTDDVSVSGGNVVKTGKGVLNILATDGLFESDKFAVEAGKLNFKGQYNGDIEVEEGATLSPGNSVGDLTVYGDVKIDAGATGLFEFSPYDEQQFDTLTIDGNDNSFELVDGSVIQLLFEGDATSWAEEGSIYQLVTGNVSVIGDDDPDWNSFLGNYKTMFALEGTTEGLFLIGLGAPEPGGSGVPEPSTWALLILGAAGLLYWRRKN